MERGRHFRDFSISLLFNIFSDIQQISQQEFLENWKKSLDIYMGQHRIENNSEKEIQKGWTSPIRY